MAALEQLYQNRLFFVDASTSITVIKKLLEIVQSVAMVEHGPYIDW